MTTGHNPVKAIAPRIADPELGAAARLVYALRQQRDAAIGHDLFSEPAWDILLDVFISECDARQLSVSAVCIGSRSSSATALRYLKSLEQRGHIERYADPLDGRRTYIRLTVTGLEMMRALIERFGGAIRRWHAQHAGPFERL